MFDLDSFFCTKKAGALIGSAINNDDAIKALSDATENRSIFAMKASSTK